jgi:simple sugar transport system permease protein
MLLDGPMKDPGALGWPQSVAIPAELELARLAARSRVHSGLLIALSLAVLVWIVDRFAAFGFEMRAVGANVRAAASPGCRCAPSSPGPRSSPARWRGSPAASRSRGAPGT